MRVEEEEKRRKDEIDNLGKVLVEARVELEGVRSENEKLAADLAAALQHIDILKDSEAPWSHRDKGSPKHDQRRLPSKQRKFRDRDTIEHDRRSASSSYIEGDTISGGRSHTPVTIPQVFGSSLTVPHASGQSDRTHSIGRETHVPPVEYDEEDNAVSESIQMEGILTLSHYDE
ncbi:hypothetical protein ADUPG1_009778 [Aduncisulcus paluster]|uniref:Uncharacterized protein n=1 Tax=Aduncisulcus paluster TaxID=2918883 RepID=A0ABQ5KZK7_9EUKA|nr:hypothetical protein ADUPG1_009778 [Aduncisulcus paluster]